MSVIDISYWQHHPDFNQVRASGVSLVIGKAATGEGGYLRSDSVFAANRDAARAAGLQVGSYFFNGPVDPTAAADYYVSVIDYRPGDIVALDIENAGGVSHWTPSQCLAFASEVRARIGVAPLMYMSSSVAISGDWSAVVAFGDGLWVAQYGSNNGTPGSSPATGQWPTYSLWQYTSRGTIPGVAGYVDTNSFGPAFASLGSTQIISTPTPPPYLAPLEDDMFKLYFRKDAPDAGSPSGVTYALGVLDPSWQTPGHNFWFEASAESRRDWRELFGFRDVDGNPQAQSISYDIWNARSNDPNRISDFSKYVPMVNAPAQITNVTAAPLSDVDIKRIVLALQAAIPAATVPVPLSELASAVAKATLDEQAQRLMS